MNKVAKSAGIILIASTVLAGCGKARMTRGYYFDPMLANEVLPGVDTQLSVINTLGTPTAVGAWTSDRWYYISTRLRFRAVLHPEREERRILSISFDEEGYVDTVENIDLSAAWKIKPNKDKTRTRGKELNLIQQLFMNVGRFAGAGQQGQSGPTGPGPNGS